MDAASRLIASFGRTVGIDDLATDDSGGCTLGFDDLGVKLVHMKAANQLLVYSPVGSLGPQGREAVLVDLMAANLLFAGTQGATLGYDAETGMVLLALAVDVNVCDEGRFGRLMENFLRVARHWQQRLDAGPAAPAAAAAPPAEPDWSGDGRPLLV